MSFADREPLRHRYPRPEPTDPPRPSLFTPDSGCRLAIRHGRLIATARDRLLPQQPHSLDSRSKRAVPQTAPISVVTRRHKTRLLTSPCIAPEDDHNDRRRRSARLQLTGPKGLFQYRTAGVCAWSPVPMLKRRASDGSACQRANAARAESNAAASISGRAAECDACTVTAMTIAGYRG